MGGSYDVAHVRFQGLESKNMSATVYHFWRQRNDIKHGNQLRTVEGMLQNITWGEARTRIIATWRIQKDK